MLRQFEHLTKPQIAMMIMGVRLLIIWEPNDRSVVLGKLKEHRELIVTKFYLTLVDLLDNSDACRDYCDVVYFNGKCSGY